MRLLVASLQIESGATETAYVKRTSPRLVNLPDPLLMRQRARLVLRAVWSAALRLVRNFILHGFEPQPFHVKYRYALS